MKTYQAIKAQIDKLEKQAQAARKAEIGKVVTELKKTIREYALTADDLGLNGVRKGKAVGGVKRGRPARGSVGVARYRNPQTGETWTGRGRPPTWIVDAKDRAAFLIEAAAAAPERRAKPAAKPAAGKKAKPAAKKSRGRRAAAAPAPEEASA